MNTDRRYEMMVLTDPNIDESKIQIIFDKLADIGSKSGAKIIDRKLWGKRRLAYEIKDLHEGVYFLLDIESNPSAISKLESFLRIQTPVLRFLTTVKDSDVSTAPLATQEAS